MINVGLGLKPAWVTDEDQLFIRGSAPEQERTEAANAVLSRYGYEERVTSDDMPLGRWHEALWVEPSKVTAGVWPESSVSLTEVTGWEHLFRVEISELLVPEANKS